MVGDPLAHRQPDTGDLGPANPHTRFSLFKFNNQPVAPQHIGNGIEQSLQKSVQIFVADLNDGINHQLPGPMKRGPAASVDLLQGNALLT